MPHCVQVRLGQALGLAYCRPLTILVARSTLLGLQAYMPQVVTLYGYAPGPTWPDALDRTNCILQAISKEFVLGSRGVRIVTGDFNHDQSRLAELALWRSLGWIEAQELAFQRWGQPVQPTCKNATVRDLVWLSPEAAALCQSVSVIQCFQEHSTVIATLGVSDEKHQVSEWHLPCEIPWSEVDVARWGSEGTFPSCDSADSTARMRQFALHYERSLNGFVTGAPDSRLPSQCYGRSRRLKPSTRVAPFVHIRASRPGEEAMRHDFLNTQVRRWFSQLRRLQSLLHSMRAARTHAEAVNYRLELWRAICAAKGFCGGFARWWGSRPVQVLGSPACFPSGLPSLPTLEAMFQDFRLNYRKFECWHMNQRARILKSRHEASTEALFKELRDPAPMQVDVLQQQHLHAILAVEPETGAVQLERPPDQRGHSCWLRDGEVIEFSTVDDTVCTPKPGHVLHEDEELVQVQTLSEVSAIHSEFVSYWSVRWQKHANTTPQHWQRFLAFATAFLPKGHLAMPPISVAQWRRALSRFRPRAARGPDGWAKDDLVHMTSARMQTMLDLLADVEAGAAWPEQLLTGFVCLLSKQNGHEDVQGFRPIVLFSIVYRTWSGIRARQVLRFLRDAIPFEAYGFLPGREAMQLWYSVQLELELSQQGALDLFGMSTDLIKAFNCLPRCPLLALAEHVGLPGTLIDPWRRFLGSMSRRFLIRGQVSEAVASTCGFPEGCPLSPVAMALADWSYHAYMHAFAPQIRSLSYVDNLASTTATFGALARSVNLTQCFCDTLALSLDPSKTFVWSAQARGRAALPALGLRVAHHARELGGLLSFERATHNAALVARCAALQPLWEKLRRSRSPLCRKLAVLPAKFWARALHGVPGCPLADSQLQNLRTQATSALRIRPAGVNSLLRLSLASNMEADPGFYQLWVCVRDLRRMAQKLPTLLLQWRQYMRLFAGELFQGPFSKLIAVLSQIHWAILEPPMVRDHEGFEFDVLSSSEACLRARLEEAWLWHVSLQVRHRHAMCDLIGIDRALLALDAPSLSPLNSARQASVRAGAFLFGEQHARYDTRQTGLCEHCSVPDSVEHRLRWCPLYREARARFAWLFEAWEEWPTCLTHHLLPPANPFLRCFREALMQLPDLTKDFHSHPTQGVRQHLFTDGSCLHGDIPSLALAAWAVVSATSAQVVACGPVPGLLQTTPRAELLAVVAALRWAVFYKAEIMLWIDALNVVQGLGRLRHGDGALPAENRDLWETVAELASQLEPEQFFFAHVPSHLDQSLTEAPYEDWVAQWNGHVDTLAGLCNVNRTVMFAEIHGQALAHHCRHAAALRALRTIFFAIADARAGANNRGTEPGDDAADDADTAGSEPPQAFDRTVDLEEVVPVDWRQRVNEAVCKLPYQFVQEVFGFLLEQDARSTQVFRLTWLELVFMLHVRGGFSFPVASPSGGGLVLPSTVPFAPLQPTVAVRLRYVRQAAKHAFHALRLELALVHGVCLARFGVSMPCDGLLLGAELELVQHARSAIRAFTATRAVTTVGSLARPLN